eukprot:GEMP01019870.1.p1 GENE.GEMP01019870.1~~GEMP01019870.1.p1  ORF type:complete len:440 (+),score=87.06 GEMP01019870.1:162-1481(+)
MIRALSFLAAVGEVDGMRDIPDMHSIPDFRPKKCLSTLVTDQAVAKTPVSIVIPCLNESWEHVSQTFLGILNNSPLELVREIILISDGGETFEEELQAMAKNKTEVRVVRHAKREGLIRAKNEGLKYAKADILIFYEPHVIAQKGWLETLVAHLERHPKAVVMPALDVWTITGEFQRSGVGYYRFEWNFNLMYTNSFQLKLQHADPYPTPATSGGIFGIRKQWFMDLNLYDEKLEQWGGDHIELAFKAWRCGGRIDMIPCSRVFHWFRSETERPYDVDIPKVVKNYVRLAEIWLEDEYLEAFYKVKPEGLSMDRGDITAALEHKERLQCKSMHWYLTHVDWEMGWEADKVCIPNAGASQNGCERSAARDRSTIDRLMPSNLFHEQKDQALGFYLDRPDTAASSSCRIVVCVGIAALGIGYYLWTNSKKRNGPTKSKKKR